MEENIFGNPGHAMQGHKWIWKVVSYAATNSHRPSGQIGPRWFVSVLFLCYELATSVFLMKWWSFFEFEKAVKSKVNELKVNKSKVNELKVNKSKVNKYAHFSATRETQAVPVRAITHGRYRLLLLLDPLRPKPFALMQPHIITLPPPCFTVRTMHSLW